MANGEGALVAQQRAAAEIPYRNIESTERSIQMGLSAWQMANAIKLKRQEIEGKLFALQMRNQQLEANSELREKMFGLAEQKAQWEKEKAFSMVDMAQQRLGIQQESQDRLWATMGLKAEKEKRVADDSAGLFEALHSQPKHPGDPGFDDDTMAIASKFPYAPKGVSSGIVGRLLAEHQTQVQRNEQAYNLKKKTWWEDYGRTVFNDKTITGTTPLNYQGVDIPGEVERVMKHTGGLLGWGGTYTPTDQVKITWKDSKGNPQSNIVSTKQLTDLNKSYQALIDEGNKLPSRRDYPDYNLFATDPKRERALKIRDDPTASATAKAAADKYLSQTAQ